MRFADSDDDIKLRESSRFPTKDAAEWDNVKNYSTTQEPVDAYAGAHKGFWWVMSTTLKKERGTQESLFSYPYMGAGNELS